MSSSSNAGGRRRATATTNASSSSSGVPSSARKDATRKKIERMEMEREERRKEMIQKKEARKQEQLKNIAEGNPGDIDFIGMVHEWRQKQQAEYDQTVHGKRQKEKFYNFYAPPPLQSNICIAVRKRPMSHKERTKLDHDSVSCYHPKVWIHSAKLKVDGITKYLTHNPFQFDHAFGEDANTEQIYIATALPLVDHVVSTQGRATVFCYGQTGSGKTYTMNGIQHILAYDLYGQLEEQSQMGGFDNDDDLEITVAFFELYGGYIQDLLHSRKKCKLLEDAKGEVNITGLQEVPAPTPEDFLQLIEEGHSFRTTHTTEANDTSSRSHAICQVFIRQNGELRGKLSLVDLAGSERGSDTKSHNAQRRAESADINTSLLSLKECIRALGQKSAHVPYRGSKLTLILKDCFSPDSKTTMIATVSPGASATDHSLNTLRYADRIKEQRKTSKKSSKGRDGKSRAPQPIPEERLARITGATGFTNHLHHETNNEVGEFEDAIDDDDDDDLADYMSPKAADDSMEDNAFDGADDDSDFMTARLYSMQSASNLSGTMSPNKNGGLGPHGGYNDDLDGGGDDENGDGAEDDEDDLLLEDEAYRGLRQVDMVPPTSTPHDNNDNHNPNDVSSTDTYHSAQQEPTPEEQAELRRTVQHLFELEEALLNQHMSNIQENAEMLTQEGKLLQSVQQAGGGTTDDGAMDEYAIQLAEYLDRKEVLIYKLQSKLIEFQKQLAKEQVLSRRVTKLTQY